MLALTAVFAAVALAMLGLAMPVTASFIIGWVIIGPALLALDVPAPAAAMFVFYYSVLSEVTPPTALAAVGAVRGHRWAGDPDDVAGAAVRRAGVPGPDRVRPHRPGEYLLGRGPVLGVLWAAAAACAGIVGAGVRRPAGGCSASGRPGRSRACSPALAGLLLLFLDPVTIAAGCGRVCSIAVALHHHRQEETDMRRHTTVARGR